MNDTAAQRLYAALVFSEGNDVALDVLYQNAKGRFDIPLPSNREMQQYVGAYVTKLNHRIEREGKCIKPGVARRTYRLEPIKA